MSQKMQSIHNIRSFSAVNSIILLSILQMDENRTSSSLNSNDWPKQILTAKIKKFDSFDECKAELLARGNKSALALLKEFEIYNLNQQNNDLKQNKVSNCKLMDFFRSFDSSTNGKLTNCESCKKFLIACHNTLFAQQGEEDLNKINITNQCCFMFLATGFDTPPESLMDAEDNFFEKSLHFKVNCKTLKDSLKTYHSSTWKQLYKLLYYRQMLPQSVARSASYCPLGSEKYEFGEIIRLINESSRINTREEKLESCFILQSDLSSLLPIETIEELLQPINSCTKKHRFEQPKLSVIGKGLRRKFIQNKGKGIAILIIEGRFIIHILDEDKIFEEYKNHEDPSLIPVDEFLIKYSKDFAVAPCLSGDLIYIPANSLYSIKDFGVLCSFLEFEVTMMKN